jgi:hypothetical protein
MRQENMGMLVNENIPLRIKEIARARGLHTFDVGDPAIMLHQHKDKTITKKVTVVRVTWYAPLTKGGKLSLKYPEGLSYTVRSGGGGTMTVGARSLRPGTAIDRIALALELSDEEEAKTR